MRRVLLQIAWFLWPPKVGTVLAYMLQSTEYEPRPFLKWFWRTNDFSRVMYRRTLERTRVGRLIQRVAVVGITAQMLLGVSMVYVGITRDEVGLPWFGLALAASASVVWAHLLAALIWLGRLCILRPREAKQAHEVMTRLQAHPGVRIAIAGSYGKTTMKELLRIVLAEGKKVAATPANMNVVSSHARFVRSLNGDEEIVLVEFGEGKPGDVQHFAQMIMPEYAVITGLAPAHLDQYKTLDQAGRDIFSLASAVSRNKLFVNADSPETRSFTHKEAETYSQKKAFGWRVRHAQTSLDGTHFELVKGTRVLRLQSGLVGLYQVGPLAFAAAFALMLGLSEKQVIAGIARTKPFEHRMQPYQLSGAWIIDDTYNGNIEGIRVGTELLASLDAKRKLYVTPGLVDQGKESALIHQKIGQYIAAAKPDVVVLMRNSATAHMQRGLIDAAYAGTVMVEDDPLAFYQNLDSFVAAGDVVLMQNDWTDNYH